MNPNATPPRVIIRHCAEYDVAAIRAIVREGLNELGLVPSGRTLVKPNLVAAGEMFPYAHTRATPSSTAASTPPWRASPA